MSKPVILIGSGGHASVVYELLCTNNAEVIAVVSPDTIKADSPFKNYKQIIDDSNLINIYPPHTVDLVNGLGSIPSNDKRHKVFDYFSGLGYRFLTLVSPKAIIANNVQLGEGVQVMHGAIIQTNSIIGKNCIINTSSIVEHDCIIGSHNHIAPGSTLSGNVTTGEYVHIGTGANIIQNITVGNRAVVGAGCTVVRDVPNEQVIIPAHNRILY